MADLYIERLNKDLPLPVRAHEDDAGLDLYAAANVTLPVGWHRLVHTGIRIMLPPGTVGMICPRSGLAVHNGITVLNAPGIIDQGFLGEVCVNLVNHSNAQQFIRFGDRIAQLVIAPVVRPELVEVDRIWATTDRGGNGHGSSGK